MERLYNAALLGDVPSLLKLLHEDPRILDRACIIDKSGRFSQSPLHISAYFGHFAFVNEILQRKSNMCLVRDQDGCNPIHVAAMEGQVDTLVVLIRAQPQAAREQTRSGETALHLCVKYNQFEALKLFVNVLDDLELLNFKDNKGNTILHLAVTAKRMEMVNFLLGDKYLEKNAINATGLTAMDICVHNIKKEDPTNKEIWLSLKEAKALDAEASLRPKNRLRNWLDTQTNSLMIVASLIATMAFQVGVAPPGGTWQDNIEDAPGVKGHTAGYAILATKSITLYYSLLKSSTTALITSLSVILLLISGLPCGRILVGTLMVTMWISISATAYNYLLCVNFVSGDSNADLISKPVYVSLCAWLLLLLVLLLGHGFRLTRKLVRKLKEFVVYLKHKNSPGALPLAMNTMFTRVED